MIQRSRTHDLGIIALEDQFADVLERTWRFLEPTNLTTVPTGSQEFLVSGFLAATTRLKDGQLIGDFNTFWTKRYSGDPKRIKTPVNFSIELFLEHDRYCRMLDGTLAETPPLQGISGASVWAVFPSPTGGVWTPETAVKVVAVETSCMPGAYIRAKKWTLVALAFDKLDSLAGAEIRKALRA